MSVVDSRGRPRDEVRAPHRVAGLFAGIGGIERGLARADHQTDLLCEIEPAAQAVLKHKFAGIELAPDITQLSSLPETTTLVTAGFPCQDLSQAGQTAGISGKNSGLVNYVFRLLEQRRVPWVLLENVSFMLRLGRGAAMRHVIEELEALGYRWAYRVMDTRAFGLPQRRERVYLLACQPDQGDPRDVLLSADHGQVPVPKNYRDFANGFYWTEGIRGLGWAVNAIPTLKGGSTIGIPSPPAIWMPDGCIGKPGITDAERLQGFPADWTEPAIGRIGRRWKLIGNAVSVNAAAWIGEQLRRPGVYNDAFDAPLPPNAAWPDAAWALKPNERCVSSVTRWPVAMPTLDLKDFLEHPLVPLSARATAGFLDRVRVSSLRFPEGLVSDLNKHLRSVRHAAA